MRPVLLPSPLFLLHQERHWGTCSLLNPSPLFQFGYSLFFLHLHLKNVLLLLFYLSLLQCHSFLFLACPLLLYLPPFSGEIKFFATSNSFFGIKLCSFVDSFSSWPIFIVFHLFSVFKIICRISFFHWCFFRLFQLLLFQRLVHLVYSSLMISAFHNSKLILYVFPILRRFFLTPPVPVHSLVFLFPTLFYFSSPPRLLLGPLLFHLM